jgi:predicted small lipoprotein YifL
MLPPILPPRFLRHFSSALAATSLVVCASFSLIGCGQQGGLYLPAKNGSPQVLLERQNVKSHYIFAKSPSKADANTTASVPAESAAAPESTQRVVVGEF